MARRETSPPHWGHGSGTQVLFWLALLVCADRRYRHSFEQVFGGRYLSRGTNSLLHC